MQTVDSSVVSAVAAAAPDTAHAHFAARLAVETDAADVAAALAAGERDFVLVDARSRAAYERGHLPGAVSIPHAEISAETVAELPAGLVVAYCWGPGCNGAARAGRALARLGRPVKEMLGGYEYWVKEGRPVERGSA
jgi:rhodanese-related sulfurtransferase